LLVIALLNLAFTLALALTLLWLYLASP
jgi:hypothetical protein